MNRKLIKNNLRVYENNYRYIYLYGKPQTIKRSRIDWVVVGTQLRMIEVVTYDEYRTCSRHKVVCLDDKFRCYSQQRYRRIKTTAERRYWSGAEVDERGEKISGRMRRALPTAWDDIYSHVSRRCWKDITKCRKQWMVNLS